MNENERYAIILWYHEKEPNACEFVKPLVLPDTLSTVFRNRILTKGGCGLSGIYFDRGTPALKNIARAAAVLALLLVVVQLCGLVFYDVDLAGRLWATVVKQCIGAII